MNNIDEYLKEHRKDKEKSEDFLSYFYELMKRKNLKAEDIYKNVDMSRMTYHKIISEKMTPSLNNAVKLAIGLRCTNKECKILLKKFGYTLPSCSDFALIIRYCLDHKIYDMIEINSYLLEYHIETI